MFAPARKVGPVGFPGSRGSSTWVVPAGLPLSQQPRSFLPSRAAGRSGRPLRAGRAPGHAIAVLALEGRAAAGHGRQRKAARWHDLADRARRQCRRQIVRPAWRSALFLVRGGRRARRRQMARFAGARPPGGGLQRDQARDHRQRDQAGAGRDTLRKILAGEGQLGPCQRDAVLGMDRKAVRRAGRPGPELEGLERCAARQVAQLPRQLSRPQ